MTMREFLARSRALPADGGVPLRVFGNPFLLKVSGAENIIVDHDLVPVRVARQRRAEAFAGLTSIPEPGHRHTTDHGLDEAQMRRLLTFSQLLFMGRSAATQTARLALQLLEEASRPDVFASENRQGGQNRQPPGAGQGHHRESCNEQRETTGDFRGSRDALHCFCRRWRLLSRSSYP